MWRPCLLPLLPASDFTTGIYPLSPQNSPTCLLKMRRIRKRHVIVFINRKVLNPATIRGDR